MPMKFENVLKELDLKGSLDDFLENTGIVEFQTSNRKRKKVRRVGMSKRTSDAGASVDKNEIKTCQNLLDLAIKHCDECKKNVIIGFVCDTETADLQRRLFRFLQPVPMHVYSLHHLSVRASRAQRNDSTGGPEGQPSNASVISLSKVCMLQPLLRMRQLANAHIALASNEGCKDEAPVLEDQEPPPQQGRLTRRAATMVSEDDNPQPGSKHVDGGARSEISASLDGETEYSEGEEESSGLLPSEDDTSSSEEARSSENAYSSTSISEHKLSRYGVYCVGPVMTTASIFNSLDLDAWEETTVIGVTVLAELGHCAPFNSAGNVVHKNFSSSCSSIAKLNLSSTVSSSCEALLGKQPHTSLTQSAILISLAYPTYNNLLSALACVLSFEKNPKHELTTRCRTYRCMSFRCAVAQAALTLLGMRIQGLVQDMTTFSSQAKRDIRLQRKEKVFKEHLFRHSVTLIPLAHNPSLLSPV